MALAGVMTSLSAHRLLRRLAMVPRLVWLATAVAVVLASRLARSCLRGRASSAAKANGARIEEAFQDMVFSVAIYCCLVASLACANAALAFRSWRQWRGGALMRSSSLDVSTSCEGVAVEIACAQIAGAPVVLVAGGEPCRDELGAWLTAPACARQRRSTVPLAFLSAGHYKRIGDFDSSEQANPHRSKFKDVDFDRFKDVAVLDREAIDTLANFTTFLDFVQRHRPCIVGGSPVKSLDVVLVLLQYPIDTAYHVPRARAVAAVVLGSRGMSFAVTVARPTDVEEGSLMEVRATAETLRRRARDVIRAVCWIFTGCSGDFIAGWVHRQRRDYRARHRQEQQQQKQHEQ
eukprot:TRINITY_DN13351_c0_g1_i2.p1 TRINITY_DN13351_c0_g1~~TRINITY_DN13351_c0_g1_i2.p1  ORF type:complete len:357 (+),score=62.62 TRINITY_DN13351_c0_g1_i2:30-1073(+)